MKRTRTICLGALAATLLAFICFSPNPPPPAPTGHSIQRQLNPTGLRFAPEPANGAGAAAVKGALGWVRQSVSREYKGPASDLDSLQVLPPVALYRMDVEGLASGRGLKPGPKADCYLYLIRASGHDVGTMWTTVDDSGKAEAGSLDMGLISEIIGRAHERLPLFEEVRAGSYEVRLLFYSDGSFTALWLRSDFGGQDLIYPVGFGPHHERLFTVPEFLAEFVPRVKKARDDQRQAWAGPVP